MAAATLLMLWVRIAVYGSLGGYPTAAGVQSFHFRVDIKTFTSLVRAIPIPILGVNTTSAVRAMGAPCSNHACCACPLNCIPVPWLFQTEGICPDSICSVVLGACLEYRRMDWILDAA